MLALTQNATQAVEAIIAAHQLPAGAGVRVSAVESPAAENSSGAGTDLMLAVVESPEPGDEVAAEGPVYIEPSTAPLVANMILDARMADDRIQFTLHEQPGDQPAD